MTRPGRLQTLPAQPWPSLLWIPSVLATRKPLLLLRFPGPFLLRFAERVFSGLVFQEPPRKTRRPHEPRQASVQVGLMDRTSQRGRSHGASAKFERVLHVQSKNRHA